MQCDLRVVKRTEVASGLLCHIQSINRIGGRGPGILSVSQSSCVVPFISSEDLPDTNVSSHQLLAGSQIGLKSRGWKGDHMHLAAKRRFFFTPFDKMNTWEYIPVLFYFLKGCFHTDSPFITSHIVSNCSTICIHKYIHLSPINLSPVYQGQSVK